jgi:hypothetical protein
MWVVKMCKDINRCCVLKMVGWCHLLYLKNVSRNWTVAIEVLVRVVCQGLCYGLDLEWSLKSHMWKSLSQPLVLLGGSGKFRSWSQVEGSQVMKIPARNNNSSSCFLFAYFIYLFVCLLFSFRTWVLMLATQVLYYLVLFVIVIFLVSVWQLCSRLTLGHIPTSHAPCIAGIVEKHHHAWLLSWGDVLLNCFLPRLAWNHDLLGFVSWVAGITATHLVITFSWP